MRNRKNRNDDSDDDDDSDDSNQLDTDNSPKNIPVAKLGDRLKTKKIVINISDTQYPIIQQVAEELGWIIQRTEGNGDWDVWWTDREIQPHTLFKMNLHQKINHFPGIFNLARKNLLGLNLMCMRQHFPMDYNFFPQTWIVPLQFSSFRHYFQSIEPNKVKTFIVKPQALSQGKGIFLTRNIEDVINGNKYVIQRYIKNPLLIDRLKFDLRIYVLMAGTDPLRLYIYHQGLARFATQPYQQPTNQNLSRSYIHLTNYSLNKSNPQYIYNKSQKQMDKGHKRTISSVYEKLEKDGVDIEKLKGQIEDAITKTVISGLPNIKHQYQYCQPEQYEGNMCFHILGFDVMITSDHKPIIIEVNHTPSFETGTPLDYLVKKNLIIDTLKIMRIISKNKKKQFQRAKQIAKYRLETGKRQIYKGKERDDLLKQAQIIRDQQEIELLGGYKKIFPFQDAQKTKLYKEFYEYSLKMSKEDNETRKKILAQDKQKKVKDQKMPKKKQSCDYTNRTEAILQRTKKQLQQNYHTIAQNLHPQTSQNNKDTLTILESQILQEQKAYNQCLPSENHLFFKDKKLNFRTKVTRKHSALGSNNQLIKYTESIKKFNELMNKFVVEESSTGRGQERISKDNQLFLNIKQKISDTRQNRTSTNLKSNAEVKNAESRNGSYVKAKNYYINNEKNRKLLSENKRISHGTTPPINNKKQVQMTEFLMGGVVTESKSSKAYTKLLKSPNLGSKYAYTMKK